ncbi:hypothetical protein [Emticicia sp. W12TSBA100-4]|uniref:hypothetical protein n=1 Tax=Emticicia sp. W12TSBA100-4 TaxID=3160965 RepID=UPI0033057BBE
MALLNLGGKKRTCRKKSKRLKAPKKNATLKQKETYVKKMAQRIEIDQKVKKADRMIEQIKNYQFA